MNRWTKMMAPGMFMMTAMGVGVAQADQPYLEHVAIDDDRPNTARVIVHAQLHPEVAVSRSLAAQPVHPHLAEVLLNEAISTWIDPLAEMDGESRLAEGHSLLRAQQLARDLRGVSAVDLQNVQSRYTIGQPLLTNTARIVTAPRREALPQPRMIIEMRSAPANEGGKPRPIPSVPKPPATPERQLASR